MHWPKKNIISINILSYYHNYLVALIKKNLQHDRYVNAYFFSLIMNILGDIGKDVQSCNINHKYSLLGYLNCASNIMCVYKESGIIIRANCHCQIAQATTHYFYKAMSSRCSTGLHAVKLLLLVVIHCIFPFKGLLENAPLYNPDFHDGT